MVTVSRKWKPSALKHEPGMFQRLKFRKISSYGDDAVEPSHPYEQNAPRGASVLSRLKGYHRLLTTKPNTRSMFKIYEETESRVRQLV